MSSSDNLLTEVITNPEVYYPAQKKTLDSRLDQIVITEKDQAEISSKAGKKLIRDKILGLFKITEVVSVVLNWNETVDKEIKQAKKEHLLSRYLDISDEHSATITELANFLSNPQGNVLFNKILRIQDDSPPDLELADHLAAALKHITDTEFLKLFEPHKYALSLIEKLSPQEMSILTTAKGWRPFGPNYIESRGGRVTSEWIPEFATSITTNESPGDPQTVERVAHAIKNLERAGMIIAVMIDEEGVKCQLTQIGESLIPYLNGRID